LSWCLYRLEELEEWGEGHLAWMLNIQVQVTGEGPHGEVEDKEKS